MTDNSILQILYYSTFILFSFFGILQLVLRNKLPLNYMLAALFFIGGFEFFCFWVFNTEYFKGGFFLVYSEIANSYLIGPAFYLYFCFALGFKNNIKRTDLLHLVPFFLSLAGLLLFRGLFPEKTIPVSGFPEYSRHLLLFFLAIFSDVSVGVYILITSIRAVKFLKGEVPSRELKLVRLFLFFMILGAAVLVAGGFTDIRGLVVFGIGFFTVLPSLYILFSFRYPEFSMQVLTAAKQLHKNKSVLNNLDVESLLSELKKLMVEDCLYRQETLSLQALSDRLKITAHQLSRLLNEHAECSFRTYINSYRVAEAKKLLCESPDLGVLEVSMMAGFNSRSSFYTAFQKETGCNPVDFRKKNCPEL